MQVTAAIYARVSTQRQEEEETIKSQIEAVEEYARKEGYVVPEELYFLDNGISGAKLDRPGLDRMRDQLGEGIFEAVICLSPDRLAREYTLQVILLEEFKRAGIEIKFVNQPAVNNDPQSQLLFGIQGIFAQYERAVTEERMRRGRLHKAREGWMVNGTTPYGYRHIPREGGVGGRWEIIESEAQIIRQVYEWYLNEEWESVSVRNIVKKMQESVPPPRKSKQWHDGFITNMLKRKQYTGMSYYNRTKNDYNEVGELRENGHGKRKHPIPRPRNEEEWIKQSIPTIIDEERWEAVQEKMKKNRQFSMRNNQKHFYMLRGLLVCGECGYTMSGRSTKPGKITYYCYYGGVNSSPDVKKHSCKITGEVIETIVWEEISKLLKNPELISQAWQMMSTNENRGKEQGEIERLESRVKKIARQQDRLLDLYQEEQIEKETYLERKQRLHQEEQNITDQLQAYIQEERGEEVKQNIIGEFEQFSQSVSEKLINPTPQLKREVIRLLIDHIVVNENEIVIKHIVPAIKDCRLTHPHRRTEAQKKRFSS